MYYDPSNIGENVQNLNILVSLNQLLRLFCQNIIGKMENSTYSISHRKLSTSVVPQEGSISTKMSWSLEFLVLVLKLLPYKWELVSPNVQDSLSEIYDLWQEH